MGCGGSKDQSHHVLNHADDSVKVALRRDVKHGEPKEGGYRPREPNPLLDGPEATTQQPTDSTATSK